MNVHVYTCIQMSKREEKKKKAKKKKSDIMKNGRICSSFNCFVQVLGYVFVLGSQNFDKGMN